MNKKAQKLVTLFYNDVLMYMKSEYKPKWSKLYQREDIKNIMKGLTSEYYWGGNSIPNTTGDIVDLLKSKYGK